MQPRQRESHSYRGGRRVITARGGKWKIRVYGGTKNGRRWFIYETVAGSRKDADDREYELKREVRDGRSANAARMTVTELCARWLKEAGPDLSPKTDYEYKRILHQIVTPAIGSVKVARLTTAQLDEFYSDLRETLSPQSIQHVHAFIRKAYNVAIRKGLLSRNPAHRATPPKVRRSNRQPPNPETLRAFLTMLPVELATYARLAAVSGCRRGELCALRWSDLDGPVLTVQRSLVDLGRVIEKGTKTDRVRVVTLDPTTLDMLSEHRVLEEKKAADFAVSFSTGWPMFTTDPAVPWRPDLASHRFRRAANRSGIKVTLQDLRHWAVTYGLSEGHSVRQVADRAGHADGSLVLSRYGHAVPSADAAIAASLGGLLDR